MTFQPAPGAAPPRQMVITQAAMEIRLLLRNGEQVLLALVIPLLVLVGGAFADNVVDLGDGRRIDVLTPGVIALAVMATSFTSLAIATGYERRYGVLKLLGATPLPRWGLLAGKVVALLVIEAIQLLVICVTALLLGWQPSGGLLAFGVAALLVILGTWAFAALGLLIAGALRAEATLALANLIFVVLLLGGAVVFPIASYPAWFEPVVALLPSGALAEGLRTTLAGGGSAWAAIGVLLAWAAVATALTSRTFRWE